MRNPKVRNILVGLCYFVGNAISQAAIELNFDDLYLYILCYAMTVVTVRDNGQNLCFVFGVFEEQVYNNDYHLCDYF